MRSVLTGFVIAVALVIAGCGGGGSTNPTTTSRGGSGTASQSGDKVLKDAVKAADAATTLHMKGKASGSGLDLSIDKTHGAKGSVFLNRQKVDLIVIGMDGYMKAGPKFWKQFDGPNGVHTAQYLAGRWLKFPVNAPKFQPITAFFSSSNALFDQLQTGANSILNNIGLKTYKGQAVVGVRDELNGGTLYVEATGTPYPVALVKAGAQGGAIEFSNWNKPVPLKAPKNVLDLSQLPG